MLTGILVTSRMVLGDVNFAAELSDLRFRCGFHVILLHGNAVSDALIACVTAHYNFDEIVQKTPDKVPKNVGFSPVLYKQSLTDWWVAAFLSQLGSYGSSEDLGIAPAHSGDQNSLAIAADLRQLRRSSDLGGPE